MILNDLDFAAIKSEIRSLHDELRTFRRDLHTHPARF